MASQGPGGEAEAAARQATIAANQKLATDKIEERRRYAIDDIGKGSRILIKEKARDGEWAELTDDRAKTYFVNREVRTGLALSGGGIRSATISLGLLEALASRGRFYGFDFMSTVSGGGYCGSFLRSLFVARPALETDEALVVSDRIAFADATLTSLPDQQYFRGESGHSPFVAPGKVVKNPLWWLRENGRYLAPTGMSDYGYALSYMARNWLTLVVYLLGILMLGFAALQFSTYLLVEWARGWKPVETNAIYLWLTGKLYSPLWPLVGMLAVIGIGIAGAYWISIPLPYGRPAPGETRHKGHWPVALIVLVLIALWLALFRSYHDGGLWTDNPTMAAWVIGSLLAISAGLLSALCTAVTVSKGSGVDFRREQTRLLVRFNTVFVSLLGAAVIDSAALAFHAYEQKNAHGLLVPGAVSGLLASAVSFLVARLPDWLGNDGSGVRKLLLANVRYIALAAAIVILALVAMFADMLVINLFWAGGTTALPWSATATVNLCQFVAVIAIIAVVVVLFSLSANFANLLALTPFYGSRLTRAYLGGSNVLRLDTQQPADVTHGMPGDDVPLRDYMAAAGPAPLHLINVTRNRTFGSVNSKHIDLETDDPFVRESLGDPRGRLPSYESSLTLYDRHGDRMVFGPLGARVGAEFFNWQELVELPSLGQLCAISGAAVGPGMGRNTSLGTSMAMTLANVRLGYWWKEQKRQAQPATSPAARPPLAGFSCLYHELLGQFGTENFWYLSDGGHSENSGALSLLERGCQFILVSDNGQDPDFTFGDLEIFIRTARTDIGMEVAVADPGSFPASLRRAQRYFFNGAAGDWRPRAKSQGDEAFALLLLATDIPHLVDGKWIVRDPGEHWIVWLKPNRFENLPGDLATYGELHPDFPQQTTANQFFDEAQWESYRRLGFEMGRRLFEQPETLAEFLPVIYRKGLREPADKSAAAREP